MLISALVIAMAAVPFPIGKVTEIHLPGTGVTVYERSSDPKVVTSYYRSKKRPNAFLRVPGTDTFKEQADKWRVAVSPDGMRVMAVNNLLDERDCETFQIYGHQVGSIRSLDFPGICEPYHGGWFGWSSDSKKIAQLVFVKEGQRSGFLTIDADTARATFVKMPKSWNDFRYVWAPGGKQLLATDGKTIRFVSPDGKLQRTLKGKGPLLAEEHTFSPKGDRFVTACPEFDVCLWSVKTGKAAGVVPVPKGGMTVHDWWDDDHLIVSRVRGDKVKEFVVMTLKGKVTRVLADVPKKSYDADGLELEFTRR